MHTVKKIINWFTYDKKRLIIPILIVFFVLIFSVGRVLFLQQDAENKANQDPLEKVSFSSTQQDIYNKYGDDEKEVIQLLINNIWATHQNQVLTFNEKEIISQTDTQQNTTPYVICSVSTKNTSEGLPREIYTFSILANDTYSNCQLVIQYAGSSKTSGIKDMSLEYTNEYNNTVTYNRIQIKNLEIDNYEHNCDQFIDYKYDEMHQLLQDYVYKYTPAYTKFAFSKKLKVDYSDNTVNMTFMCYGLSSTTYLCAKYDKSKQSFDIFRVQNSDQTTKSTTVSGY